LIYGGICKKMQISSFLLQQIIHKRGIFNKSLLLLLIISEKYSKIKMYVCFL